MDHGRGETGGDGEPPEHVVVAVDLVEHAAKPNPQERADLVRQDPGAWPNSFRKSRFIPAVEYINASRARTQLIVEMKAVMEEIDVFVTPTFGNSSLRVTNLTGHPSVTVPNRFAPINEKPASDRRNPSSITFVGGLFKNAETLALAHAFQSETDFHKKRPPIS